MSAKTLTAGNTVLLREAILADVPIVVRLVRAAFEQYRGRLDPPSGAHHETEEQLHTKLSRGGALLASLAGEDIGCVVYEREGDHLYASRLAVLPSYRRQGAGRKLMDSVEEKARRLNLKKVRLGVRLALPDLLAYYGRRGYRVVEYRTHESYSQPTYVMLEKLLDGEGMTGRAAEQ